MDNWKFFGQLNITYHSSENWIDIAKIRQQMCVLGITKYSKLGKALLSNFDIPTKFSH